MVFFLVKIYLINQRKFCDFELNTKKINGMQKKKVKVAKTKKKIRKSQ